MTGIKFERNFSLAINDLLQNDELVDVKLVVEGHLISAHRLVLSAMSPYFLKMFTQVPVNQQAFGEFHFLKTVSIGFLYRKESTSNGIFPFSISKGHFEGNGRRLDHIHLLWRSEC